MNAVCRSVVTAALVVAFASLADAIDATTADDICAGDADPCVVTGVVHVAPGSILDFGQRVLSITGDGQLDFGSGSASVLAGPITISTDGNAFAAAGPAVTGGGTDSGLITVRARRACSAGPVTVGCVNDSECQFGTCGVRRCTGRSPVTCTDDATCAGVCGKPTPTSSLRCLNSTTIVRCTSNADCDNGLCSPEITCTGSTAAPRTCASDSDCDFGSCSVGEGTLSVHGGITGTSDYPASIVLWAADSVSLAGTIEVSGTDTESDGGEIRVRSYAGDVTFSGSARLRSGGKGTGGYVDLQAANDVTVLGPIDVAGGDSDGGAISLRAGRDAVVRSDLNLRALSGIGFGGELDVEAGRDIRVGKRDGRLRIMANGQMSTISFGGDGGDLGFYADGDITLGPGVDLRAMGGGGENSGGRLTAESGGTIRFDGRLNVRGQGLAGGGYVDIYAAKDVEIADGSRLDLRGVVGGSAAIQSEQGASFVGGTFLLDGTEDGGQFWLEACRVSLSGKVANRGGEYGGGSTGIVAHESMRLLSGSSLLSPGGANDLYYRTDDKPPLLAGITKPAPKFQLWSFLPGCPDCGNSEIDEDETCDDGNTMAGDGCSELCRTE